MRVTVVATGLGQQIETQELDKKVKLVQNRKTGEMDYSKLDRPTVIRNKSVSSDNRYGAAVAAEDNSMDYLDIPAFLRRQAD